MQRVSFGQSYKKKPLVLAMGLFDAVHQGHRALLKKTVSLAKAQGAMPAVFTLSGCKGASLFTEEERAAFLAEIGIELMIVAPFGEVQTLPGREFLTQLFDRFSVASAVCGEDYRFGSAAACGVRELKEFCSAKKIEVEVLSAVTDKSGEKISTTRVKNALSAGDLAAAKALLGRNYSVSGAVQSGYKIGRTLGFPTANIDLSGRFLPKAGVYAVRAVLPGGDAEDYGNAAGGFSDPRGKEKNADSGDGAEKLSGLSGAAKSACDRFEKESDLRSGERTAACTENSAAPCVTRFGIANLGAAPTVEHRKVLLEVHFDGFSGDLYGKTVTVEFLSFLRDIQKFASKEALSLQLEKDLTRLRAIAADFSEEK